MYKCKNIVGTSDNASLPSGYSSWLDFWEKKTGKVAFSCRKFGCCRTAEVGAHVQVEGYGNYWYIVPLCKADNNSTDSFYVSGPLVPVNANLQILW
jgi:hypothetical protein